MKKFNFNTLFIIPFLFLASCSSEINYEKIGKDLTAKYSKSKVDCNCDELTASGGHYNEYMKSYVKGSIHKDVVKLNGKLFTGVCETRHKNGNRRSYLSFGGDGTKYGTEATFYENGNIKTFTSVEEFDKDYMIFYDDGKLNSLTKYSENGKIASYLSYYEDGQKYTQYDNSHLIGFYEDGSKALEIKGDSLLSKQAIISSRKGWNHLGEKKLIPLKIYPTTEYQDRFSKFPDESRLGKAYSSIGSVASYGKIYFVFSNIDEGKFNVKITFKGKEIVYQGEIEPDANGVSLSWSGKEEGFNEWEFKLLKYGDEWEKLPKGWFRGDGFDVEPINIEDIPNVSTENSNGEELQSSEEIQDSDIESNQETNESSTEKNDNVNKLIFTVNDPDGYSNLRNKPGGDVLQKVNVGTTFEIIGEKDNHKKVRLNDGTVGYIHKSRVVAN